MSVLYMSFLALTLADPFVVRLQRVPGNGTHFYVGRLSVGVPKQSFSVLFDTASGHILLPHSSCQSSACHKHQGFAPANSKTAQDVNSNGQPVPKGRGQRDAVTLEFSQADLGEGLAQAVLVKDQVCLSNGLKDLCTTVDVMAAVEMQRPLFEEMPYDGIVGLGLGGLSAESGSDFFSQLLKMEVKPQLGLSLGVQTGELFIGEHEMKRMKGDLQWFPVLHPADGFWEVSVQSVRLGNVTIDDCRRGCRGVVDRGASRLGVQRERFGTLWAALAKAEVSVTGGCLGDDLYFDLGAMSLQLRVEDYAGAKCTPQLGALDLDPKEFQGVYAFGEAMLRQYYTAFDWATRSIGFAVAAPRRVAFAQLLA